MLKDGRLTGVKVGKHWRFSAQEVNDLLSGSNPQEPFVTAITENVLPLHCMQPVQDVFAEIAEVGSVTTDTSGQPLTRISNSCDFCKLILGSPEGREACIESWRKLTDWKDREPEFFVCHAGLNCSHARIEVENELIAILVSGQFYHESPDPEEEQRRLQHLAAKYDIDFDLLSHAGKSVPVLDERKSAQIGGWLEKVARTFEQISSERAGMMYRLEQISLMSNFKQEIT
jgi:ligand-binding sensor protein